MFNFRMCPQAPKYFNTENFPNYGITKFVLAMVLCWCLWNYGLSGYKLYGWGKLQRHQQCVKDHVPLCCSSTVRHPICYMAQSHRKSMERAAGVCSRHLPFASKPCCRWEISSLTSVSLHKLCAMTLKCNLVLIPFLESITILPGNTGTINWEISVLKNFHV